MCWIGFASKDRSQLPAVFLERAHKRNDDAWGIMWPDGEKVNILRDVTDHADFRKHWLDTPLNRPIAAHFRYGTSGAMDATMAHPFPVLTDENGNVTLAMMHNGVLQCFDEDRKENLSDTAVLIRDFLQPMLAGKQWLVRDKKWQEAVGAMLGGSNKLVFMEGDGTTSIVNDWQGDWEKGGVWHSNKYSIEEPKPVVTYGGGGYYGGSYGRYDDDYWHGIGGHSGSCPSKTGIVKPTDSWQKWLDDKSGTVPKPVLTKYTGSNSEGQFPDGKRRTLVYLQGEPHYLTDEQVADRMFMGDNTTRAAGQGEIRLDQAQSDTASRIGSEPIDALDTTPLPDDDGEEDLKQAYSEDIEAFLTEAPYMSETEMYNWVASNSMEMIADVLMELVSGGIYR